MGFVRALVRLIGVAFVALRIVLPILAQMILQLLVLEVTAVSALLRGVPETVDIIAEDWQRRSHLEGMDSRLDNFIFQAFRVLAYVVLCIGWIIMAAMTMALVRIVF
jgi:hypothetical protein